MKTKRSSQWVTALLSVVLFAALLVVVVVGTSRLTGTASDEGVRTTRDAIERAAVLCYATEGFYPPGLDYIEQKYGVQIDYDRYAVSYSIFASNIRPIVVVSEK